MKVFGLELFAKRAPNGATPAAPGSGGWGPRIMEPFTGAWQKNVEWRAQDVMAYHAVFACVSRISQDVAKLRIKLVKQDKYGIWNEVTSPAFGPVLRKPNRYQNHIQFKEGWIASKLTHGNALILKERDARGVVVALYVLDWKNVTPLVAPDGSVYYELKKNELAGLGGESVVVPASEVIHDRMNCLFHPLVGISPIYACGMSASQGQALQKDATNFATNGSSPGGFLTSPNRISDETARRLKSLFETGYTGENRGKVAVLGDGLAFSPVRMTAADAKVVEQLRMTAEIVCSTFHVPAYKVGIGPVPTYNGSEALGQMYYEDCLQSYIESMEACLDEGLGLLDAGYGSELDLDGLIRMDTQSKIDSLVKVTGAGIQKINEARAELGMAPVEGGDTPYLQQQNYALSALAKRDAAEPPPTDKPVPSPAPTDDVKALLDRIKALEERPQAVYRGVWADGAYGQGDMVTQGGGLWHAQRSTEAKPGADDSWKLAVKRGEAHV